MQGQRCLAECVVVTWLNHAPGPAQYPLLIADLARGPFQASRANGLRIHTGPFHTSSTSGENPFHVGCLTAL